MPIEITNDFLGYHAKDGNKQIISIQIFEVTTLDNNNSEKTVCEVESIERYGADTEQETEAVRLIFDAIAEEYEDEPYIQSLINKKQLLDPEFENYSHDFSQKKVRENLVLKILQHFYLDADDSNGGAVIYGKKRPCFTCHSTLQSHNEESLEFVYNPRRGLFFLGEFKGQEESVAESTTHELIYSGNVYESYPGRSGCCTLSDSEEESQKILAMSKSVSTKLNVG